MNIRNLLVSYFVIVLMILGSFHVLSSNDIEALELVHNYDAANIDIISLLPDPDFDNVPEVVVNGSSSEFMALFTDVTGDVDSYIELKWTHEANTPLDFAGQDPDYTIPDCNDFVYAYQEFDWPYDQRPGVGEMYLNYSTYRSGDFADGAVLGNNLMFRVFVWAIDSSGDWIKLYESREAVYTEEYQMKIEELNYFQLSDIFDGMVEQAGTQEDPTDKVKLAIGLAPTYRFESYSGTEPWTFYDGSVSVRVTFCDFYAYVETEEDPSSVWQPEYNVTYGTTLGEAFPTHPNASDEVWNMCYGMVTGNDGAVYVTGNTRTSYELYDQEGLRFRNQFLLKYNPALDLLWAVNNDNNTQVRSMTYHDGFIYTTGYKYTDEDMENLIVTKWSSAGIMVWESEWGTQYSQVGVGVAVHENDSVYIVASDYDQIGLPGYLNSSILKFDSNGILLWERQILYMFLFWDQRGDLYIQGDYLYFSQGYGFSIMNVDGECIRAGPGGAITPDGNNGVFMAFQDTIQDVDDSSLVKLFHLNATGYPTWNTTYIRQWPNGRYHYNRPVSMAVTPEDTLLLLVYSYDLNLEFILLTYDFQGILLSNRTISNEIWPLLGGHIFMDVGRSGRGYFAFDIYDGISDLDINIQAFEVYQVQGGFPITITSVIIIASTVVIIGAVGAIIRVKRQEQ
ncbi:MAG: hypothetical protein RTV72_00875 [Candidatus Thorarchaeota archaeon]